jgi:hypothetical protein
LKKNNLIFELALVKEIASSHKPHFYKVLALANVAD